MSEYLHYEGFKWLKNIDGFDVMSISEKSESEYNYDNNKFVFYKFYRNSQNFKDRSPESKYNDDISKFYSTLSEFKNHKAKTDETQQRKDRVINNAVALYNNHFDSYRKATLDEIKTYHPYQFKKAILLPEWQES